MLNLKKVAIVVLLGVFILGATLTSSLFGCSKGGETMGVTDDGLVTSRDIPAIDASAPVRVETATFALG